MSHFQALRVRNAGLRFGDLDSIRAVACIEVVTALRAFVGELADEMSARDAFSDELTAERAEERLAELRAKYPEEA